MCIYCNTRYYRKIYENHFGIIPRESNGRSYDIHHIDGNHSNNSPNNLKCITVKEHYKIHKKQGDWTASMRLAASLKMGKELISELARKAAYKRFANGTHTFIGLAKKRVKNGTHNFLGCNKGNLHPHFDHTIYTFKHSKTNEVVSLTRYNFYNTYNLRASDVCQMIKGNVKSVKGWPLK